MAIMESIDFSYAGENSIDYGIYNVSVSGGMYEETFLSRRSILETNVRGNPKPYFNGVQYEPLTLKLTFAFKDTWDDNLIRKTARWLNQSYYKPLFFSDNIDRIFYCIPVDDVALIHNGLKQGYLTLTMRCDSHYTYTRVMSDTFDYSSNTTGTESFGFMNGGDVELYPEIWITKVGNGDITIKNITNGGQLFGFTGLIDGEIVYIDNERQYIETSVPNTYRYSAFNNNYMELVVGLNTLQITGAAKLDFRYQYKTLQ
jgi:phage-related protein